MPAAALTLGPIEFQEFEIPPSIRFGGQQRLAIHRLSSGRRTTDILGPEEANITFSGILSGPSASLRSHEIDALRSIGQELHLAWNAYLYNVVISSFKADYTNEWWIPYRISCSVLSNLATLSQGDFPTPAQLAIAAIDFLQSIVPGPLFSCDPVRTALSAPGIVTHGRQDLATAFSVLETAQNNLTRSLSIVEANIAAVSIGDAKSADFFMSTFESITSAAAALQGLAVAQDCIGQAVICLKEVAAP